MRLLEVNGVSLLGASHQEAVNSLRSSANALRLLICDGYDAAEVERLQSEGRLIRDTKSASESVCSLDRDDDCEPSAPFANEATPSKSPEPPAMASSPVSPVLGDRTSEKVKVSSFSSSSSNHIRVTNQSSP